MSEHRASAPRLMARFIAGVAMIIAGLSAFIVGSPSLHGPSTGADIVVSIASGVCGFGLIGAGVLYPFKMQRIGFWLGVLGMSAIGSYAAAVVRHWI